VVLLVLQQTPAIFTTKLLAQIPMTFLELAEKVVREERKPLTPEEIWQIAKIKGYDVAVGTQGKTPWASIGAQLYMSVKIDPVSIWLRVGRRPTRFFLKELNANSQYPAFPSPSLSRPAANIQTAKDNFLEKDLHPLLAYFAFHNLKAYCRTINHLRSDKKEFGEWVHPDMVGVYFPLEDWVAEVIEFSSAIGSISLKMFSFELKRELTFGNLREAFFQTVSNSSWANEGYLAAARISQDEEFQIELQRLSSSFGIGIIELSVDDPDSSRVLYPPKQKEYLDWENMNKLTLNQDFTEFLGRVKRDLSSKEIRKERYDTIFSSEELVKRLSELPV
jgi:hypothetical protein